MSWVSQKLEGVTDELVPMATVAGVQQQKAKNCKSCKDKPMLKIWCKSMHKRNGVVMATVVEK